VIAAGLARAIAASFPPASETSMDTGLNAGKIRVMETTKVTVELPLELLNRAQSSTGEGITGTIRRGLELVAASRAQEQLHALRGKVKFSLKLGTLRTDR